MGNDLSQSELARAVEEELNIYFHHSYGTHGSGPICGLCDGQTFTKCVRSSLLSVKKFEDSFLAQSITPPSIKYHIDGKEVHVEAISKNRFDCHKLFKIIFFVLLSFLNIN